jgi:hypothetical protein
MRRTVLALSVLLAVLVVTPGVAAAAPSGDGWQPAPSAPWDRAAGVLCDFPVHAEPISDHVRFRTLTTAPRRELYAGELIVRVTNTATGRYYDADASGSALVTYNADGGSSWQVAGPTLIGFRSGGGTLPRGLWRLNGLYRIDFDAAGYKTVTTVAGHHEDVCTRLS